MRENMGLYRGKRLDSGEWAYGYYVKSEYYFDGKCKHFIIGDNGRYDDDGLYPMHVVDRYTVGEFTGLTDKNGKRIFEGDIIDMTGQWWDAAGPAGHDSPICVVEYDSAIVGFNPFANYDCDCGVYIDASGCEVIGNIHDNPDLIGENNDN